MSVTTVRVSNVSFGASQQDIKEFFSFSGDIEFVEMRSEDERSQVAYVTFKDPQGAETAVLLSDTVIPGLSRNGKEQKEGKRTVGATIVDQSITVALDPEYQLPPIASVPPTATEIKNVAGAGSVIQKAEDVVSSMLAKGFILGKDAVNKAKAFDDKHQFTFTASAKVASLDQKIGLSEKITTGATIVNEKVKEMDQKFQVSEKTKSAIAAAEQTVNNAGTAIMKNRYVLTGTSWVTGAFNRVTKAAAEVGQETKDRLAEDPAGNSADAQVHVSSESPNEEPTRVSSPKGLIL